MSAPEDRETNVQWTFVERQRGETPMEVFPKGISFFGPLAQQVEQLPLKQEVGGSIPPWPTCRGGEIGKHARLRT